MRPGAHRWSRRKRSRWKNWLIPVGPDCARKRFITCGCRRWFASVASPQPMQNLGDRPGRSTSLLGRDSERALLDGLVAAIWEAESRSLVLRGEAGVGKTALLEYLVDGAGDVRVLRAVGVESEMELAYAGLHQLCGPLLDRLEPLWPAASGHWRPCSASAQAPRRTSSLSAWPCLSLLSRKQPRNGPLLVRRRRRAVAGPGVGADAGVRGATPDGRADWNRVRRARAGRTTPRAYPGELRGPAQRRCPRAARLGDPQFILDEQIRDRVVAETRGNTLALLELPRGLTATAAHRWLRPDGRAHTVPGRIEESFVRRP